MIKIFVDSGSSIKTEEAAALGVEILPLKIRIGGREYLDGVDLGFAEFYKALIEEKQFPATSLPELGDVEARVKKYTDRGDDVIIITISSGISGTYNAISGFFKDDPKVRVVDSRTAVGGVRILALEALKHLGEDVDTVVDILCSLVPRIRVVAIPDTLEYLHRGGRLSRAAWVFGNILQLKPLIGINSVTDGKVFVISKERGKRNAMIAINKYLADNNCDVSYPIVPSFTYDAANLDKLVEMTDTRYHSAMIAYDELDPAISCHWGPGAFGYIFVSGK